MDLEPLWALFVRWEFYAEAIGALAGWWGLACIIARLLFRRGTDAVRAATSGAIVSLIICVILVPTAALMWAGSLWLAVALGVTLLFIPVVSLLVLGRAEPVGDV